VPAADLVDARDVLLPPGELAPDFEVDAHDGSRVRLSELASKYVVLWFYPEADTPG
jgi:peroxiredoxin Q/BCP